MTFCAPGVGSHWYVGSQTSLSSTRKRKSPTRPNEREPSTSSAASCSLKYPRESIQPPMSIDAKPKKSALAWKSMTHSPGPRL